jgi:hypothetical protein
MRLLTDAAMLSSFRDNFALKPDRWIAFRTLLREDAAVNALQKWTAVVQPKTLSRRRMIAAVAVAVAADGLQLLLLPFAWTFAESAVDVVAMAATTWLLGFHPLLLPTVVVEFFPVVDAFPTWTACVVAVIALRRREEKTVSPTEKTPVKSD